MRKSNIGRAETIHNLERACARAHTHLPRSIALLPIMQCKVEEKRIALDTKPKGESAILYIGVANNSPCMPGPRYLTGRFNSIRRATASQRFPGLPLALATALLRPPPRLNGRRRLDVDRARKGEARGVWGLPLHCIASSRRRCTHALLRAFREVPFL